MASVRRLWDIWLKRRVSECRVMWMWCHANVTSLSCPHRKRLDRYSSQCHPVERSRVTIQLYDDILTSIRVSTHFRRHLINWSPAFDKEHQNVVERFVVTCVNVWRASCDSSFTTDLLSTWLWTWYYVPLHDDTKIACVFRQYERNTIFNVSRLQCELSSCTFDQMHGKRIRNTWKIDHWGKYSRDHRTNLNHSVWIRE